MVKLKLVFVVFTAAIAGTHARLRHPNYFFGDENDIGGSGDDGLVDDEDYEGSGKVYEASESVGFPNSLSGFCHN